MAKRKKGMSLEEKRTAMLGIFHETVLGRGPGRARLRGVVPPVAAAVVCGRFVHGRRACGSWGPGSPHPPPQKEVFTLKELEKLGTKAGVGAWVGGGGADASPVCARRVGAPGGAAAVTQTIKDVVQSLVDDGMVELEKIGSANYYWSFPSKAICLVRCGGVSRLVPAPPLTPLRPPPHRTEAKQD